MAESYISFFKKCWEFLKYVVGFFRGRKQEEVNNANTDLQNGYDDIDKNKENNKQDDTENRLNNMFK